MPANARPAGHLGSPPEILGFGEREEGGRA
jgi:hypothetical protein